MSVGTLGGHPWAGGPRARLTGGEVHVWHASLDVDTGRLGALVRALDQGERARADGFRVERDRCRFVAGRGVLREILGRYADAAPSSLRFAYSGTGKPCLLPQSPVQFNVSHSGERLVVAIARGRRLGVDVERHPSLATVDRVSHRVFSEAELKAIRSVDRSRQPAEFARLWARKEAYLKADGRGVAFPLDRIDVATRPEHALVLDAEAGEWAMDPAWTLSTLEGGASLACCVAVEAKGRTDFRVLAADRS